MGTQAATAGEVGSALPRTVTGRPLADRYDLVLAHEHLLIDISCYLEPGSPLEHEPVTAELRPSLMANAMVCADNLLLDDLDVAVDELAPLREAGALVVDVTPENVGRDPAGLAEVSRLAGVDVVMGCGPYIARADAACRSADEWRRELVAQLRGPVPRPSVIGEIGTSDPIELSEREALIGAVRAQAETGVPLYVHLHPFGQRGHEVLSLVEAHGGEVSRTVLCHLDAQLPDGLDYARELLERGCFIAFDVWGYEAAELGGQWPTDAERAAATVQLVSDGYGERLLHSQDVCMKMQLRRFGGPGYDHLPTRVRPLLLGAGLSEETVAAQLAGNALSLIARQTTSPNKGGPQGAGI